MLMSESVTASTVRMPNDRQIHCLVQQDGGGDAGRQWSLEYRHRLAARLILCLCHLEVTVQIVAHRHPCHVSETAISHAVSLDIVSMTSRMHNLLVSMHMVH